MPRRVSRRRRGRGKRGGASGQMLRYCFYDRQVVNGVFAYSMGGISGSTNRPAKVTFCKVVASYQTSPGATLIDEVYNPIMQLKLLNAAQEVVCQSMPVIVTHVKSSISLRAPPGTDWGVFGSKDYLIKIIIKAMGTPGSAITFTTDLRVHYQDLETYDAIEMVHVPAIRFADSDDEEFEDVLAEKME